MNSEQRSTLFYTGNSYQVPGDTILISGQNIGLYAKTLFICRLSDRMPKAPQIVAQSYYDHAPSKEDMAYAVSPHFRPEDAISVPIIQKTADSVKFCIPKEFEPGIYSVRIVNQNDTESIAYINVPDLYFVTGDEGGIATTDGYLRIVGSCIAPKHCKPQICLIGESGSYTVKGGKADSPYSVTFSNLSDIPCGTYRLFYHNGLGGETTWSLPHSVTISKPVRNTSPIELFNVKNYGALGQKQHTNDTPAILSAIRAAEKNGGGIVYFPKGEYVLNFPLHLPEGVTLQGDGIRHTKISFLSYNWDIGQLPIGLIHMNNNTAVDGIDFSGTRMHTLFFACREPLKNISITNCRISMNPYAATEFHSSPLGNHNAINNLFAKIHNELVDSTGYPVSSVFILHNIENLHICKNDITTESSMYTISKCTHVLLSNNRFTGDGSAAFSSVRAAIAEHNRFDNLSPSLGGDGIYFTNNRMKNRKSTLNLNAWALYSTTSGKTYATVSRENPTVFSLKQDFRENSLSGMQFLIQEGPGEGQMRRILTNTGNQITLESPFTCPPSDTESKVSIMAPRSNMVFYQNQLYNAGEYDFLGIQLNAVLDSNVLERSMGFASHTEELHSSLQPNWYLTYINNNMSDAYYRKPTGYLKTWAESLPQIELSGGAPVSNIKLGVVLRNNVLEDGYFIHLHGTGAEGTFTDIIIEKNLIINSELGIRFHAPNCDGTLIQKNYFENVEAPYVFEACEPWRNKTNITGDPCYRLLDNEA